MRWFSVGSNFLAFLVNEPAIRIGFGRRRVLLSAQRFLFENTVSSAVFFCTPRSTVPVEMPFSLLLRNQPGAQSSPDMRLDFPQLRRVLLPTRCSGGGFPTGDLYPISACPCGDVEWQLAAMQQPYISNLECHIMAEFEHSKPVRNSNKLVVAF
jgi:hypothetical protein